MANNIKNIALIIGCGVAGPVLAILLKRKGYTPIVFEKVKQLGDAGASLMLMPNGMKVLNLAGVADEIYASSLPLQAYCDMTASGRVLGSSHVPSHFQEKYGQRGVGIRRTELNLLLKNKMLAARIELREGWELCDIHEDESSVTASFTNGEKIQGLFLVGCDGLKAASRTNLLKRRPDALAPPTFTGLAQTSGISKVDGGITESRLGNWFGEGVHFISYPVSPTHLSWAVTIPQKDESAESWRLYKGDDMKELQEELLRAVQGFEPQVTKLVQTAERLLKFGIFDREELQPDEWYSTRCVLVGDAAHPTSPHLGQGANQAMEDCYHLGQALGHLRKERETIEQADLQFVFAQFAQRRQPRTSSLVRGARAAGEKRVVKTGKADCEARDQKVIAEWKDTSSIEAKYDALCREPQLEAV